MHATVAFNPLDGQPVRHHDQLSDRWPRVRLIVTARHP